MSLAIFGITVFTSRDRYGYMAAVSTAEAMHCGCTTGNPWPHMVTSS